MTGESIGEKCCIGNIARKKTNGVESWREQPLVFWTFILPGGLWLINSAHGELSSAVPGPGGPTSAHSVVPMARFGLRVRA